MTPRALILAPLRGVTIRAFREAFAPEIAAAGFSEAITPFIPALPGRDPLGDSELRGATASCGSVRVTPQFIGKDPAALAAALARTRDAGFPTADLNCGCPFPMVRNKGRGSGLLRTPDLLRRMLEAGCATLGPGAFSVKARLGIDRPDELAQLLPILNEFPLRFLTVHGRLARQMYSGSCDLEAVRQIAAVAKMPVVLNGDIPFPPPLPASPPSSFFLLPSSLLMIGRSFVRWLGARDDAADLLRRYIESSRASLPGEHAVMGRIKELVAYWKDLPRWRRRWDVIKVCRTSSELLSVLLPAGESHPGARGAGERIFLQKSLTRFGHESRSLSRR